MFINELETKGFTLWIMNTCLVCDFSNLQSINAEQIDFLICSLENHSFRIISNSTSFLNSEIIYKKVTPNSSDALKLGDSISNRFNKVNMEAENSFFLPLKLLIFKEWFNTRFASHDPESPERQVAIASGSGYSKKYFIVSLLYGKWTKCEAHKNYWIDKWLNSKCL